MQPQDLTLKLERTQKYTHRSIFSHRRRNKANARRDIRSGHAKHAHDEVSRPVLRTMGKAGIPDDKDRGGNNRVTELITKGGGTVQGLRQKFRGR